MQQGKFSSRTTAPPSALLILHKTTHRPSYSPAREAWSWSVSTIMSFMMRILTRFVAVLLWWFIYHPLHLHPGLSTNAEATGMCVSVRMGDAFSLFRHHANQWLQAQRLSAPAHLWPVDPHRWSPGELWMSDQKQWFLNSFHHAFILVNLFPVFCFIFYYNWDSFFIVSSYSDLPVKNSNKINNCIVGSDGLWCLQP